MSGGEQQRVAIARAIIITEPKIVLADEPTGNLDTKNSEAVLSMLSRLNKELGQTIVMITHNPEAAAY
jgi:putative ABC transport system ATP-binding protein